MAITSALRTALLHFLWQGSLVALLLWITLFALRKSSAHARYIASCVALALLTLAPVLTTLVLRARPAVANAGVKLPLPVFERAAAGWAVSASATSFEYWVLPAWSLGVVLFSLRFAWGCKRVSALRHGQSAGEFVEKLVADLAKRMGVSRPVRAVLSALGNGPSVVGWVRPVILVPSATILGLTPEQLEAVFAHELAHIRRHDYLVNLLQMTIETLLFYHPAVWWVSSRIRHERELCCDDVAVAVCGDAVCYARALTHMEKLRASSPVMALGSTGGPLSFRIQRLLGVTTHESVPSRWPSVLAAAFGVLCLVFTMNWGQAQSMPVPAPRTQVLQGPPTAVLLAQAPPPPARVKQPIAPVVQPDLTQIEQEIRTLEQELAALRGRLASVVRSEQAPTAVVVASKPYVIGAGDVLQVAVWHEPDISGVVEVRTDGKITLPLIHEIQAEGVTPVALASQITQDLSTYLSNPDLTVSVQQVKSKRN